ncbi:nitrilase-related carbon-nitrogen hydrolase [Leptospira sp. 96542]|nr:nitrilase-related carbon-nitrogen hydrolase [Leptospira sp. 96542]
MRFVLIFSISIFSFQCQKQSLGWEEVLKSLPKTKIKIQKEGQIKRGSVIGIEPYLTQFHYSSEESFYSVLNTYLDLAKEEGLIAIDRTIIVFPEYIGTWLIVTGDDKTIFAESKMELAMEMLVKKNFGSFLWTYLFSKNYAEDHLKESVFRMKAWQMSSRYQSVFSRLAREYRVAIVAGSIVLPSPRVVEGKITPGDGPLENVSFYFHSNGRVDEQIVKKIFPILDEQSFISEGKIETNLPIKTPLGKLSTFICADSWFPNLYQSLDTEDVEILTIPSLVAPSSSWNDKWNGYNGYANPQDVNPKDIGAITKKQAWKKYAMPGRITKTKVKLAVNVFFRGKLWDLEANGESFLYYQKKIIPPTAGGDDLTGRIYALFL